MLSGANQPGESPLLPTCAPNVPRQSHAAERHRSCHGLGHGQGRSPFATRNGTCKRGRHSLGTRAKPATPLTAFYCPPMHLDVLRDSIRVAPCNARDVIPPGARRHHRHTPCHPSPSLSLLPDPGSRCQTPPHPPPPYLLPICPPHHRSLLPLPPPCFLISATPLPDSTRHPPPALGPLTLLHRRATHTAARQPPTAPTAPRPAS